jgi:hypothetical protein
VLDGHGVLPAGRLDDRALTKEFGHRSGRHGGRHDHDAQRRPIGIALQPAQQGQGQVALQVALVELVDDHGADAGQDRVGHELAREHALGDEADPRARADRAVEADLVADGVTHALATLLGHALRGHARSQPARLQHHHVAVAGQPGVEQGGRDARGLARARGRDQHRVAALAQRCEQVAEHLVDGQ